jgi:hypothetical protein
METGEKISWDLGKRNIFGLEKRRKRSKSVMMFAFRYTCYLFHLWQIKTIACPPSPLQQAINFCGQKTCKVFKNFPVLFRGGGEGRGVGEGRREGGG